MGRPSLAERVLLRRADQQVAGAFARESHGPRRLPRRLPQWHPRFSSNHGDIIAARATSLATSSRNGWTCPAAYERASGQLTRRP